MQHRSRSWGVSIGWRFAILGGLPLLPSFSTQYTNSEIELASRGPDKLLGTADDFVAGLFRFPYFNPVSALIRESLSRLRDYPASADEVLDLLSENGLRLDRLTDPWGGGYRPKVSTFGDHRRVRILSSGPDRTPDTWDDVQVANFTGPYFTKESEQIQSALDAFGSDPESVEGFTNVLLGAGINLSDWKDDFGNPYLVQESTFDQYEDRVRMYTYRVYSGPVRSRTEVTPVMQTIRRFQIMSQGPDGVSGTLDDFSVAEYPFLIRERSADTASADENPGSDETAESEATQGKGSGILNGVVTDPSGAVIPGATMKLEVLNRRIVGLSEATEVGEFRFSDLSPGYYQLTVSYPGFQTLVVSEIPILDEQVTDIEAVLEVGSATASVMVADSAPVLNTESASMSVVDDGEMGPGATFTPRIREYFPETLLWLPEVITREDGTADVDIPLADSITNWRIALIASTRDGRFAETELSMETFQPFFIDFEPPPVVTSGDRLELPVTVRNYTGSAEAGSSNPAAGPLDVAVTFEPSEWARLEGSAQQSVSVPPSESVNVIYPVVASSPQEARQRITATAQGNGDAIEKVFRVNPDGQQVMEISGDLVNSTRTLNVTTPAAAIEGSSHSILRIYPNLAATLLEGARGVLMLPHGCAEQTISAGFANLTALRYALSVGIRDAEMQTRAINNIQRSRADLARFQNLDGSVSYWENDPGDIAVTAQAIEFLLAIDDLDDDYPDLLPWSSPYQMERMARWLVEQQVDGRWIDKEDLKNTRPGNERRSLLLTANVAHALAGLDRKRFATEGSLDRAYSQLVRFAEEIDEPYMMAELLLGLNESIATATGPNRTNYEDLASGLPGRLVSLARRESEGLYWDLQANTPFYGWGRTGRTETTALVMTALSEWSAMHPEDSAELEDPLRRGLLFLIHNQDLHGGWYSTQATLLAMKAVAAVAGNRQPLDTTDPGTITVQVDGQTVQVISMEANAQRLDPIYVDLSAAIHSGAHEVRLIPSGGVTASIVRLNHEYWLPWDTTTPRSSAELRLEVGYGRTTVAVQDDVNVNVHAERVGFQGYGMMLAEIGLPPGADVDRSSLERSVAEGRADGYELLPDRVIFYLWPRAGGVDLTFGFRPRMAMQAKSATSILYDYNNPEALSEAAPLSLAVH